MDKLLLTPAEAACVVGLSRTKIYELMAGGQVESVRIGRCRRIPAVALAAYVNRLRLESGPVLV